MFPQVLAFSQHVVGTATITTSTGSTEGQYEVSVNIWTVVEVYEDLL